MTTEEKQDAAFDLARHMIGVAQRAQSEAATTQALAAALFQRWAFDMVTCGAAGLALGFLVARIFPRLL